MTDTELSGAVPGILGATYRSADVPPSLPNPALFNPWTEADGARILMKIPHVARYLIEDGNKISIQPDPGADPRSVKLFLHVAARGYLIHQRFETPLNAVTVIAPNGAAVALSATSGLGKSTLAAELCRRGWLLVADSITRLTLTAGRVLAWPSDDKVVLWRSACESFGMDIASLEPIREGMEKFYVPMPSANGPVPLKAVVRIQRGSKIAQIDELSKEEAAASLPEWLFRWHQFTPFPPASQIHGTVQRIAQSCRVAHLSGAREVAPFELADLVARMVT